MRDVTFVPRSIAALLLLGLVTLTGCGGAGSTASPTLQSIQISPTNPSVAASTSVQLTATGIYSDNSHADVTVQVSWTTSNPAVATVGAGTGKASGISAGSAVLTASLQGQTAVTTLTVTPASLVSIAITPSTPSIAAGTTQQFTATGTFSDNTTQNLTADMNWISSTTAVATISSGGMAIAVGPGNATISATCNLASTCGSLSGSTTLTVTPATLVSIAVTPPTPSIALGTSEPFTATGTYSDNSTHNLTGQVAWASDSNSVATISNAAGAAGLATPVAVGTTHITAGLGAVTSPAVTLTVTPATLVSIAVTPPIPSIALGTSEPFTATGMYSDNSTHNLTSQVTWASDTTSVAAISNATGSIGLATPVAAGTTHITAGLGGVTSPAVTLTVTPATLVSIAVTPPTPSIAPRASVPFTATGTYSDNSTQILTNTVTWASSDVNIASISNATGSEGQATGLAAGSTSVSAALGGVTSPTVTLTVTAQVESVLYSFTGGTDGRFVYAGLIQDAGGNFYGTTSNGGANGAGTVFQVTPSGVETVLYSFGGADGTTPTASLIQGADGNFYGTTLQGGANGTGTVFKVTPTGVETVLWSFGSGTDGATPYAGLIQGADGNFYGTTEHGGANGAGTAFKLTPTGVETVLWSFGGGTDGATPLAGLIQGADGNFYGTTLQGGASSVGTVFKLTPTGVETVLHSFANGADGGGPQAALIQGTDGNFYGTSGSTVFKITPAGVETVLHTFTGGADGQDPAAGMIQGADGNFYGTTYSGGASHSGTIFMVTPAGVETVLWSFGAGTDGTNPQAVLIQGADGHFYGTTLQGGASGAGTVFKF